MDNHDITKARLTASHQIEYCLERVDFFTAKSTAKYARKAGNHFQRWAERWLEIDALLEELQSRRIAEVNQIRLREDNGSPPIN